MHRTDSVQTGKLRHCFLKALNLCHYEVLRDGVVLQLFWGFFNRFVYPVCHDIT